MYLARLCPYVVAFAAACGGPNLGLKPGTLTEAEGTPVYVPDPLIQTDDGTLGRLGQAAVSLSCTSSMPSNQPHTLVVRCGDGMVIFAPNGNDPHWVTVACAGFPAEACRDWAVKIQKAEAKI